MGLSERGLLSSHVTTATETLARLGAAYAPESWRNVNLANVRVVDVCEPGVTNSIQEIDAGRTAHRML
jgi:hypothetical protein